MGNWGVKITYDPILKFIFNQGIRPERLSEFSKLDAWLYFLSSDDPKDISRIVETYPRFKEYYAELLMFRYQPKELIEMYDVYQEAMRVADRNEVKYMIKEQEREIQERKKVTAEQDRKSVV